MLVWVCAIRPVVARELDRLNELIVEAREQVDAARVQLADAEGNLRGLELARDSILLSRPTAARHTKSVSKKWRSILRFIESSNFATIDEIMEYIRDDDLRIARHSVRSQLSLYAASGLVLRVDEGTYALTDEGRDASGAELFSQVVEEDLEELDDAAS